MLSNDIVTTLFSARRYSVAISRLSSESDMCPQIRLVMESNCSKKCLSTILKTYRRLGTETSVLARAVSEIASFSQFRAGSDVSRQH